MFAGVPLCIMKFINIYACSFYASQCRDPFSTKFEWLYTTWTVTVRIALQLDRTTHRFLIEAFSKVKHLQTMMICQFLKFLQLLVSHNKFSLRFLHSLNLVDQRTVYSQNVNPIWQKCREETGCREMGGIQSLGSGWMDLRQTEVEDLLTRSVLEMMESVKGVLYIPRFNQFEAKEMFHKILFPNDTFSYFLKCSFNNWLWMYDTNT